MSKYIVEDKQNVKLNGVDSTLFVIREEFRGARLYVGNYSVEGLDNSDESCLEEFYRQTGF